MLSLMEFKKHFMTKTLLITVFVFILLNVYGVSSVWKSSRFGAENMRHIGQAYWEIYSNTLEGNFTDDKIDFAVSAQRRLSQIVNNGNYSKEYDAETITGYLYGDLNLFQFEIVPKMEYQYMYSSNMSKVLSTARKNIQFYQEVGNQYEINKNQLILRLYRGREIASIYDTYAYVQMFQYNFSSFILLLILVIGISPLVETEQMNNMNFMLKTAVVGKRRISIAKYKAIGVFALVVTSLVEICNYILFSIYFRLTGSGAPIYANEAFELAPFPFKIQEYCVVSFLCKLLGALAIASMLYVVTRISKTAWHALVGCPIAVVFLLTLSESGDRIDVYLNPIRLLCPYESFNHFDCIRVFENAVPVVFVQVGASLLIIATCIYLLAGISTDF